MTSCTLRHLFADHKNKVSDKWSFYLDAYEDILSSYRDQQIRLLEIGIQNGGSLEIWSRYFSNAQLIIGCDVNEACRTLRYSDPRISVVIGDANTDATQAEILDLSTTFDVILDDGSHRSGDIVSSFARYFPYLREGGLYIVEDLHCSYWGEFGGGLFDPYASISFFKRLVDIVNFEHWAVQGQRPDLLNPFTNVYGCKFSGAELARIYSVEFRNSMCFIRKTASRCTNLGPRVVSGADALIDPTVLTFNGKLLAEAHRPDESNNEWSNLKRPPELELAQLRDEVNAMNQEIESTRQALREMRIANARKKATLNERLRALQAKSDSEGALANHYQQLAQAMLASTSWRITSPLRRLSSLLQKQRDYSATFWRAAHPGGNQDRERIKQAIRRRLPRSGGLSSSAEKLRYEEWIQKFDVLQQSDLTLIAEHSQAVVLPELLVIWFLPHNDAVSLLNAALSLTRQICSNWQAILVAPGHASSRELDRLLGESARISVISALSEATLAAARGRHCLLIKGTGQLSAHATYMFGIEVQAAATNVYCDEDVGSANGRRSPRFAPSYSPEYSAVGSLALVQGSEALIAALAETSPLKTKLHNLVSREVANTGIEPRHIPFILFHAESEPPFTPREQQGYLAADHKLPKTTIIIPTRDRLDFLEPCIRSILEKTDYPRDKYEIVVVDNGSSEKDTLQFLDEMARTEDIKVLRDPRKFNYSRLNNEAVAATEGDVVAFVNNDTVIIEPLWLRHLAFHAIRPEIGAVGAKLLYPDLTVQHGGVILGIQGVAAHAHLNLQADAPGYMGLSNATHAVSAVTGACLVLQRSKFNEIGGFDENLAVAFNDVLLCIALAKRGYRNLYVGHPTMIHFESKTRGFDDTEAKQQLFRQEASYARSTDQALFKDDPFYNSNLSLERVYDLAFPPRSQKPWYRFRRQSTGLLRILMLSSTHQIGHGVAVVVDLQARHLAAEGHTVFVGGPLAKNEFAYPNCERIYLDGPQDAAIFAFQNGIDCIVMHTPPFYSTARWLGTTVKTLAYDYGEPDPDFFSDAAARKVQLQEKAFCLEMADALYAISEVVRAESPHQRMGVIPLGNSHLTSWDEQMQRRRIIKRVELGLSDSIVVLNVCRFHEAERHYKGVDEYCNVKDMLSELNPTLRHKFVFVLAGKGTAEDVMEMESSGLRVFANISDEELVDLYCCADIYANFSRWEGYNLGIGQALAFGLPVVASDIPAHRAFDVSISDDTIACVNKIVDLAQQRDRPRSVRLMEWTEPLKLFSEAIAQLNSVPQLTLKQQQVQQEET